MKKFFHPILASTLVICGGVVYAIVGRTWGFGDPGPETSAIGEASVWCERVSSGLVREKFNTFSNLGFVVAGVAILATLARDVRTPESGRFIGNTTIALLYGYAAVFLGPGSAFLHGTGTVWGGWADVLSMVLYIWIPTSYNLTIIGRWSQGAGLAFYGVIATVYAVGSWFVGDRLGINLDLFAVAVAFWIMSELLIRFPYVWLRPVSGFIGLALTPLAGVRISGIINEPLKNWWLLLMWVPGLIARGEPTIRRNYWPWAVAGVGAFFGAFAIWQRGFPDHPSCSPDAFIQPHGVWHLLCAVAAYSFFRLLRTERLMD